MLGFSDISHIFRRRKKKLSLIYDNSADIIALFERTPDGRYVAVSVNKTFLKETKRVEHEVLGKPVEEYFSKTLIVGFCEHADLAFEYGSTVRWKHEVRMPRGQRVFSTAFTPVDDGSGKQYVLTVTHDITADEGIERIKNDLVSLVSHELGTPLSLITSKTHSLLNDSDTPLTDDQYTKLLDVEGAARHVRELLELFVSVTRLETEEVVQESTNMVEVLDEVIRSLEVQGERRGIRIIDNYCDTECLTVPEKPLIRIALLNLVSNAVKYSYDGGVVAVKIDEVEKGTWSHNAYTEGDMYRVQVTDGGPGIPKKDAHRIFSKLYRAENARKSGISGTGLGLYIVRQIVFFLGGNVWFESEEGRGATFFLLLPKRRNK